MTAIAKPFIGSRHALGMMTKPPTIVIRLHRLAIRGVRCAELLLFFLLIHPFLNDILRNDTINKMRDIPDTNLHSMLFQDLYSTLKILPLVLVHLTISFLK